MEFIKKNLAKIILAASSFCCAILMLIPVFVMEHFNFTGASQTIGLIVFFAGITAVLCLKMFDKVKSTVKYVLIGTGVLALVFLSIGAAGLSKTDPQGAIGSAYAYFANVKTGIDEGEIKLAESKANVEKLKTLNAGIVAGLGVPVASGGLQELADEYVKNLEGIEQIKQPLMSLGFGDLTLAQTPVALGVTISLAEDQISTGEAEIAKGKTQINDVNAAALSIKFLYVGLIITMGATPLIVGVKKVFCKKDEQNIE